MSNQIKGKVTEIFKTGEKDNPQYGKSAQLKLTIDNGAEYTLFYNYGKNGNLKPEPVAIGDEVEFQWIRNDKFGTKDIINKKDNYTFKNLTNPNAVPEKKQWNGNGGKYQKDPEEQRMIINQSCIGYAIEMLKHNTMLKNEIIDIPAIKLHASALVEWVYSHKPKSALKTNENPVKNDNPPVDAYSQFPTDDVPNF